MIIPSASRALSAIAVFALLAASVACGGTTPAAPSPGPPSTVIFGLPPVGPSISTCGSLAAPGSYSLASDISASGVCLTIVSSGVTLDCRNHAISGLVQVADNLSNVTITNCSMRGGLQFTNGTNITIDHNQFMLTGAQLSAAIIIASGSGNRVTNNVIDGGYHGQDLTGQGSDGPGADDGILLADAMNDTVTGNSVNNVFDAGIEGVNAVWNTTIANNTIVNATEAGISSYHCTSWQGDTVSGNNISQSQHALLVNYTADDKCFNFPHPRTTDGAFSNNLIIGNLFRNPLGTTQLAASLVFLVTVPASAVTGNVLRGNDFGNTDVTVAPQSGFSNGGGNVCGNQGNFAC